ncbi:hypothetical protein OH460_08505 [Vibrio sp. Makdt]|uniref:hypothetical protein n=1 Tax=Vibrio sp. Makdt TaxID=2998828 RepID=UPI0022CDA9C5|nr:hypothetical protein [Vibrio sp. Makdt]MDA0152341.1 hypothetical protein [Vibrio sp. Makdt]
MKTFTITTVFAAVLALTGCDDETFRVVDDIKECTQVDLGDETLDVKAYPSQESIGYFDGNLVKHSTCTPASITVSGSATTYSYYQYGNLVNSKNGVSALKYWYASDGKEMLEAQRVYVGSNGETVTREDGPLGSIQLMQWTSSLGTIRAENKFDQSEEQKVTVNYGQMSKERSYNDNTAQWDCIWKDSGSVVASDAGCLNEAVLDTTHLGVVASGDIYWQLLAKTTRSYETDEEELKQDIQDYFKYF